MKRMLTTQPTWLLAKDLKRMSMMMKITMKRTTTTTKWALRRPPNPRRKLHQHLLLRQWPSPRSSSPTTFSQVSNPDRLEVLTLEFLGSASFRLEDFLTRHAVAAV
jgi:hypothetical protein